MYFSELLSKITLSGENQTPTKQQIKTGSDILKRATRHIENTNSQEKDIVCRVINKGKVNKRSYDKNKKEQKPSIK